MIKSSTPKIRQDSREHGAQSRHASDRILFGQRRATSEYDALAIGSSTEFSPLTIGLSGAATGGPKVPLKLSPISHHWAFFVFRCHRTLDALPTIDLQLTLQLTPAIDPAIDLQLT